jgi:hypothetical protein
MSSLQVADAMKAQVCRLTVMGYMPLIMSPRAIGGKHTCPSRKKGDKEFTYMYCYSHLRMLRCRMLPRRCVV